MPNMDDFHAFQSTTGGGSGGGCSGGCLSPTIITIVVIVAILYIMQCDARRDRIAIENGLYTRGHREGKEEGRGKKRLSISYYKKYEKRRT